MSRVDQTSTSLPDTFIWLYDGLNVGEFLRNVAQWDADPFTDSIAGAVEADARKGKLTRQSLEIRLNNGHPRSTDQIRYACLLGLDRAFMAANDAMASVAEAEEQTLVVDTAAHHRLDSGEHGFGGALLTNPVRRYREDAEERPLPEHPREAFESVIRVSESDWSACDLVRMPEEHMLVARDFDDGLLVSTTPLIADPDELHFDTVSRDRRRYYRIEPKDLDAIRGRIAEVVAKMDGAGAVIGLAPELTLTPATLDAWREALTDPGRPRPIRLRWIVAGTGDVGGRGRRVNKAVVLDGRRGMPIACQGKRFRFDLKAEELVRWKITDRLGNRLVHEDIDPAERLQIFEAGEMRFAILVCEDAARVEDYGALLRAFAVTHIFVPIFGRPVHARRWERAAADVYTRTGATVLVANSAVVRTLTGDRGTAKEPRGTGLAVWPEGAHVLDVEDPADIACVRVFKDGSVKPA